MFKIGDKVKCVDPGFGGYLNIDTVYTVVTVFCGLLQVNTIDNCSFYSPTRFILAIQDDSGDKDPKSPWCNITFPKTLPAGIYNPPPEPADLFSKALTDEQLWLTPEFTPKCECGVDKVGSGLHSDYCPKFNRV